jgi:hypothetical protein
MSLENHNEGASDEAHNALLTKHTHARTHVPAFVEQSHGGEQPTQALLVHLDLQVRHEVVETVDVERRRVGTSGAQRDASTAAAIGVAGRGGGGRVGGDDGVVPGEMVAQSAQVGHPFVRACVTSDQQLFQTNAKQPHLHEEREKS